MLRVFENGHALGIVLVSDSRMMRRSFCASSQRTAQTLSQERIGTEVRREVSANASKR